MKRGCRILVEFKSDLEVNSALRALKQEEEFKKRSLSKITIQGKSLLIEVNAEDLVALRATLNSYLRALQTIESVNGGNCDE